MPAIAELEQIIVDQNHDHVDTCTVVNTRDKSVTEVLSDLHLTNEFRDSEDHRPGPPRERRQYDGWFKYRTKENRKVLRFVVPVDCGCSRDCCGHCCGLSYEMTMMGKFLVIITSKSYNY